MVSPRTVTERVVAQIQRIVALPAEEAPPLAAVADDDAAARERIVAAWNEAVAPSFARFLDVLREYLPHAAESNAVTDLPGGDAIYAAEIRSWTTLPLDPKEVHDLGNGVVLAVVHQEARPAGIAGHVQQREGWVYLWVGGLIARLTASDIDEARAAAERLAESRG